MATLTKITWTKRLRRDHKLLLKRRVALKRKEEKRVAKLNSLIALQ